MKLYIFIKSGFQRLVDRLSSFMTPKVVGFKRALQAWKLLLLASFIFLLCVSPSFGQDSFTLNTASASRGTTLTVFSNNPVSLPENPEVELILIGEADKVEGADEAGEHILSLSQIISVDQNMGFEFLLPLNLALGEYNAIIKIPDKDEESETVSHKFISVTISGSDNNKIKINSRQGELLPTIESIYPPVVFPVKEDGESIYSFAINGSGFSNTASDNELILLRKRRDNSFSKIEQALVCWEGETCSESDSIKGEKLSTRQLKFFIPENNSLTGELGVQIRIGDRVTDSPYPITLSRVEEHMPSLIAFIVLIVLIIVLYYAAQKYKLLIDQDTKTFSLSRLQFYLWTFVAIFSYLYLLLSRNFVQGKLEFIDIPDGLPGIVLFSAATTTFAIGISNTRGSKGSGGHVEPKIADFFSAGGSVVLERLQFFLWTIIGIVVYLIIVLSQSPGQIQDLPTIPSGFLQLSGISSLGYLGGKLARKPGPVISNDSKATYVKEPPELDLEIKGRNLSKYATFKIEETENKKPIISSRDVSVDPEVKEAENNDPNLGKTLKFKITGPNNVDNWLDEEKEYSLTITNPDGQLAVWKFKALVRE